MATTTELLPIIKAGAWVRLGHGKGVPKHLQGRLAMVDETQIAVDTGLNAKGDPRPDAPSPRPVEYQTPETKFLVRTRDELNETFECTRAEFDAYSNQGRNELENHG